MNLSTLSPTAKRLVSALMHSVAGLFLLASLLLLALRIVLPAAGQFDEQIADALSERLGQPIAIGHLEATWQGWTPVLEMHDFQLLDRPGGDTLLRFASMDVSVRPVASLLAAVPVPGRIRITGASFAVTRHADRTVSIAGLGATPESADGPGAEEIGAWLLAQPFLEFRSANVIWTDAISGRAPFALTDVNVLLRNEDGRHQLEASTDLPPALGESLRVVMDIQGDVRSGDWSGHAYARGVGLQLDVWPVAFQDLALTLTHGSATVEAWSEWRHGLADSIEGRFEFERLTLQGPHGDFELEDARGTAALHHQDGTWELRLGGLDIRTERGQWPTTTAEVSFTPAREEDTLALSGAVSVLPLSDLRPLIAAGFAQAPGTGQLAESLRADGVLEQVRFALETREGDPVALSADAEFRALGTGPLGAAPGFQGLHGRLSMSLDEGELELWGDDVTLSQPRAFREPLRVGAVDGTIRWARSGNGWTVAVEHFHADGPAATLDATAAVRWWPDRAPVVTTVVDLESGDVANVHRMLPYGIMGPAVSSWLSQAFSEGRVEEGRFLFHGSPAEAPFRGNEGVMVGWARFADTPLDYFEGWPTLPVVGALLTVEGATLKITEGHVRMYGSTARDVEVGIADLTAAVPVLDVLGRVRGPTSDLFRFANSSPLRDQVSYLGRNLEATGSSQLDLELHIPLPEGELGVRGVVKVADNELRFTDPALVLGDVTGTFHFGALGGHARNVKATLFGEPVTADILRPTAQESLVRYRFQGRLNRLVLERAFGDAIPAPLLERVSGGAPWEAVVRVPRPSQAGEDSLRLEWRSELRGLGLALPAPFGKPSGETRELSVRAELRPGLSETLRIGYASSLDALFKLATQDGEYRLRTGHVRLGRGEAEERDAPGIRVDGALDTVDLGAWLELLADMPPGSDGPSPVDGIVLRSRELRLGGQRFADVTLDAAPGRSGGWSASVSSEALRGRVTVPAASSNDAVRVELDRLALTSGGEPSGDTNPATLPALDFYCESLGFDELELGQVWLSTVPEPGGLRIKRLQVTNPGFKAEATGGWQVREGRHSSSLDLSLNSEDVGLLLTTLGYPAGVSDGRLGLHVNAKWPAPPAGFALETMEGRLSVSVRDGRLPDVEPGATGRAFGLITLASLPRRLKLDFSDLFDKGFSYDRIEGSFTVEDGNAYTNDLLLESPAARIDLVGRTGLVSQDYDKTITVTPKLTSSLPIVGAVGGVPGIGIGAAIWLAEKVFKTGIVDKAARYEYTVTGSWDNPTVTRVQREPIETEPDDTG